jgi:hypothetical protein
MTKQELKTLRAQFLLLGGLFLLCIVSAGVVASQRPWFEKHIYEVLTPLPEDLRPLYDSATRDQLDPVAFKQLSEPRRLALYDHWLSKKGQDGGRAPAALMSADPGLYRNRAARSIVCGNPEQKELAVRFLEQSNHASVVETLTKSRAWARRHRLSPLISSIDRALETLRMSAEKNSTTSST